MKPLPFPAHHIFSNPNEKGELVANRLIVFVVLCTILYFGQDIFIPIVLALLLAVLLAPLVRGLQKINCPRSIAVLLVVILAVFAISATGFLVGRTLANLAAELPSYEANLREKARSLKLATASGDVIDRAAGVLKHLQVELERPVPSAAPAEPSARPIPVEVHDTRFGALQPLIGMIDVVAHPLVQLGIVILMLTFILFNREDLRNRLIRLAGTDDIHRTTLALDEAGQRLSRLFMGQLAINASAGLFIGVSLFLLGVPGAFLWGLLTVVLRFVPFIGTIMGSVFPIVIALAVSDGWLLPASVAGVVIGAELIAGQVLEPVFLGRMTGVSSTAIVVSAAFWASLWGPIGLILATPITIGLLVVGRHIEALRFLDIMLGTETVLSPDHSFYQRLLAGDSMEAVESAQDYKTENNLQGFLETVAVPALQMALADQVRGVLSRDKAHEVASTFSDSLDEIWADIPAIENANPPVIVVSQPGVLNFAAAAAYSALLTLKAVPHRMLPQDAVAPGKFPDLATSDVKVICITGLRGPSAAQIRYLERRIKPHVGEARILNIAWSSGEDRAGVHSPASAVSLLPASPVSALAPSAS